MLLAGIPGGIRTGPPIKAFGDDDLGESHLFTSAAIFEGEREGREGSLTLHLTVVLSCVGYEV
jgi:hypothetical protein